MHRVTKVFCSVFFIIVLAFGYSATAKAAAPFSDSFDTYANGGLYAQGAWQGNEFIYEVTDKGCFTGGKCLVSSGTITGFNHKSGTDLSSGEWHLRFYIASDFARGDLVPSFFFGSSNNPTRTDISIFTDAPGTTRIRDNLGNILGPSLPIKQWHTLSYKWDMTNANNCTFAISVDNGPYEASSPSVGNPTNCYDDIFPDHLIGDLSLHTYYVASGQVYIDDIGDGPIVSACITNCSSTTTSQLSDTFDSFDTNIWKTLFENTDNFSFNDGKSGDCYKNGCIAANTISGRPITTYEENGVGKDTGAFTVWSRTEDDGANRVHAAISFCMARYTNCANKYRQEFDYLPNDNIWHQYFFAWRQGVNHVETCILTDDKIVSHCNWKETLLPLGAAFDGIALRSASGLNYGGHVWFDELQDATDLLTPSCTKNCNSNVMFLPGIEGSRLYAPNALGFENQIWEPDSFIDGDVPSLDLTNNSTKNSVYTKQGAIIDQALPFYNGPNIYKTLIASMNKIRSDGFINDWETIAYDWRLDYQELLSNGAATTDGKIYYHGTNSATSSPYIIQELKRLAANSRSGKVTIIAHSNGGLLAKTLAQQPGIAQYIDKIILVASPQLGSPKAIGGLLNGFKVGFDAPGDVFFNNTEARDLAQNTPMAYNLLPSTKYLEQSSTPIITFNQSLEDWQIKYSDPFSPNSGITSESGLEYFMTDASRTPKTISDSDLATPTIVSKNLFDAAIATHASLDSWTPTSDIQIITIAGWGNATLSSIEYTQNRLACLKTANSSTCSNSSSITFNPKVTHEGDGTVQEKSASWATAGSSQFWVDLVKINKTSAIKLEHSNIFESQSVENLLSSLITNAPTAFLPNGIEHSKPTYNPSISNTYFILHSPLTLGFKDVQGNYSGANASSSIISSAGVDYQKFGEVQWLSVPKELAGQIVMQGTGSGSFTLDVQEVKGDTVVATTTFAAVPSATSTIATLAINPSVSATASSTLNIDFNGDGIVDSTLNAKQGAIVLLTPQDTTAPSTTLSLVGTKGTNNWFTSNVQVQLSATNTLSGVLKTVYSLDGATTTGTSTTITSEGIHTLTYHSEDNAGNSEIATSTFVKIDKTAPEVTASASTTSNDLDIVGLDNLSSTTITKMSNSIKIVDQAGNTTMLTFAKTFSGKFLTYAKLNSIQYGSSTSIALPSSFLYVWNILSNPAYLLSQTVVADNQFGLAALYDKSKNKTSIIVLKKNQQVQAATSTGLATIKLSTNKGAINYSW